MIFNWFKEKIGPGSTVYGILKPCYRCVYQKSYEPILIFSFSRGPRVIVKYKEKTYTRKGSCIGFKECGRCLEKIDDKELELPCNWIKI